MSQLCHVCQHINFAAILTPRERDPQTGEWRTIFRPEWSGNGKDPCLGWPEPGEAKKSDRRRFRMPHIRTADYYELSDATQSDNENDENEAGAGQEAVQLTEAEAEAIGMSTELVEGLATDMSDSEQSDGSDEDDGCQAKYGKENSSPRGQADVVEDCRSNFQSSERDQVVESGEGLEMGAGPSNLQSLSDVESAKDDSGNESGGNKSVASDSSARHRVPSNDSRGDDVAERRYSSDEGTSSFTWSGDSRFDRDQKIDIQKQLLGNWTYQHGQFYNLGSIWDIRSRRYECELCQKLWQRMRNEYEVKNVFLSKSRCLLKLLEFKIKGNEDGPDRDVVMLNLLFVFGFKTRQGWNIRLSYVFHGTHTVLPCSEQVTSSKGNSPWHDDLLGQARIVGRKCDFDLFRKWLAYCEQAHNHEEPQTTGEMVIRLIDVHRQCLTEWKGPTTDAPRYVALSYVWGVTPQNLLLTNENITEMKEPGILKSMVLSKTIEDAVDLVVQIGEKYLWVDALCIIQDCLEDQAIQIPQMYNIYSKAVVTVIAASGEDANAGLPGVRCGSRGTNKFSLEVETIRVNIHPPIRLWPTPYNIGFKENYLSGCRYLSRAWTLQEAFLSRRTLIFHRGQVFWECATCTWCEGTHWESSSLRFIGQRAIKGATPEDVWKDNFDRQAYDLIMSDEEMTYEVQPNSYECLVRVYTERELSYDEDILNAFAGILSFIEKREQTKFFFGLRRRQFGNDLLFNITTATPRRLTEKDLGIPSWSWLAWRGTAEFANEVRNSSSDLVKDLVPCDGVKCYVLEIDEHGQKRLRALNETGGWQFRSKYVRRGEGIYDPTSFYSAHSEPDVDDTFNPFSPTQEGEKVSAWVENVDAEPNENWNQTGGLPDHEALPPDLSATNKNHGQDANQPLEGSSTSNIDTESLKSSDNIPEYSQTLTIADVESHKAFPLLKPDFHILFCTFSSTVELRTEEDEVIKLLSQISMAGTKRHRRNGISSYRDTIQRNLYLYTEEQNPDGQGSQRRFAEDRIFAMLNRRHGKRNRGQFFGRLPQLSKSWSPNEYMRDVPDGIYTVLWMNNNQLPMFGHLLCRPPTSSGGNCRADGVLERVCGVLGPTEILTKEAQERWRAEWGCFVLG